MGIITSYRMSAALLTVMNLEVVGNRSSSGVVSDLTGDDELTNSHA